MTTEGGDSPGDWLDGLLSGFDVGWLAPIDGLAADQGGRSGVRRISARDVGAQLDQVLSLYRDEKGKFLGVVRHRLGPPAHEAEDVLQEVMRKLCQSPPNLREPGKLRSYVYTAIRNETSDWGKRSTSDRDHRAGGDDEIDALVDPSPEFDERIVRNMVIARAMATLSPREREMIELVEVQRLTVKEAAERLGIKLGTAKAYHHTARGRLREDPSLVALRAAA